MWNRFLSPSCVDRDHPRPSTRPDPKVSLARRWPKGSGTPVGQSGTTHARPVTAPAIHNFRVPARSVTYPPGGGLLAVLWPQGWVYWPNNGHCSPCHTKLLSVTRRAALARTQVRLQEHSAWRSTIGRRRVVMLASVEYPGMGVRSPLAMHRSSPPVRSSLRVGPPLAPRRLVTRENGVAMPTPAEGGSAVPPETERRPLVGSDETRPAAPTSRLPYSGRSGPMRNPPLAVRTARGPSVSTVAESRIPIP